MARAAALPIHLLLLRLALTAAVALLPILFLIAAAAVFLLVSVAVPVSRLLLDGCLLVAATAAAAFLVIPPLGTLCWCLAISPGLVPVSPAAVRVAVPSLLSGRLLVCRLCCRVAALHCQLQGAICSLI